MDFAAGDIGAVWGVTLVDGRRVVVKALRPGADLARVAAVVLSQQVLVDRGFPCAEVLDGPSVTDGVVTVIEQWLDRQSSGDPHVPADRAAMAAGLAWQIELLGDVDGRDLVRAAPAWTRWADGTPRTGGLWPDPHDPIFDFAPLIDIEGAADHYAWLDDLARGASSVLQSPAGRPVVGHTDWVWQNVAVSDGVLQAAFDWDSLAWADEPAVVGLCAGAFSQGGPHPPDALSHHEVVAFLDDYQRARGSLFSRVEQERAGAATTWVRCYNARCQLDNRLRRRLSPPAGSFIDQLEAERDHPALPVTWV